MIILDDQTRQQMKRCIEVTIGSEESFVACLIVQNNHPTINSSMPNNFHANSIQLWASLIAQETLQLSQLIRALSQVALVLSSGLTC